MTILDLYLIRAFFRHFFLLVFVLALLFGFFDFLAQLEEVGHGNYTLLKALTYVFLTSGGRIYDLLPMISLLASLLSLGTLGDRNELLAMQAAGMDRHRMGLAMMAGLLVLLVIFLLGEETVFPRAEHRAWLLKARALSTRGVTPYGQGFWARDRDTFIHVEKVLGKGVLAGIEIFSFDDEGRLRRFLTAQMGKVGDDHWLLIGVSEQEFLPHGVREKRHARLRIRAFLKTGEVKNLAVPPEFLSLSELWRSKRSLEEGGQNAYRYGLLFWQKVFVLPTAIFMLFLALSFVLRPYQERGRGFRVGAGAIFGLFVYLGEQVLAHLGLVLEWPPLVVAAAPCLFIFLLAFWRWRAL
ncbi:MAG: LPS export ABC transporter permease LptG [Thermodesulfobacteria bacterium]|nr:LPS export ABC transporter permease LptG [Thermodesulfobacteriota bacterium]